MPFASPSLIRRVYQAVEIAPATSAELAVALRIGRPTVRAALCALEKQGHVQHVLAAGRGGRGRRRFVYGVGPVEAPDDDEDDDIIMRDDKTEAACRAHLADLSRAYVAPLPSMALRESMVPVRMSPPL